MSIKVIAFDADDTLWVNEPYFRETENEFCQLMEAYLPQHTVARELLHTEIKNLTLYGYGIKGFMLSMIETALTVSNNTIDITAVDKIITYGKALLARPIVVLEGVEEVLQSLKSDYRLVVATKGDLLDQERKLKNSGLDHYFHHVEVMSEKQPKDYKKLLKHLDILPEQFLMIGNSLKSDVLPVLDLGGHAIHIPFHTTWAHEHVDVHIDNPNFRQVEQILDVLPLFISPSSEIS
ncbi:HAD family hydrolase [Chitinophaga sancti]|uniref:HAD family hydrolase n=1 Tax=Chitinophaga sancti TaxID=1004 RepID=A0A1K1QCY7_9BACT|nr:HAD family hydrolase [Chitinophaga sancti]WQD61393.1 HAD family hydrolase [Chitinophaga sancti]WQG93054.1 HAD family hydrolase [Chitinophaga sancti]SFW57783.1 putative hydrolase of the HAD superfamily [Chitinophaga sancti]